MMSEAASRRAAEEIVRAHLNTSEAKFDGFSFTGREQMLIEAIDAALARAVAEKDEEIAVLKSEYAEMMAHWRGRVERAVAEERERCAQRAETVCDLMATGKDFCHWHCHRDMAAALRAAAPAKKKELHVCGYDWLEDGSYGCQKCDVPAQETK